MRRIGRNTAARCLAWALVLLVLPACQAVETVDGAMRRMDVLDRVFEPDRYGNRARPAPLPPPVPAEPPAAPLATGPEAPLAEAAGPEPREDAIIAEPLAAPPAPEPPPRRDPAQRTAALLRENPWLAQFWGELNAAQQGRVQRTLARRGLAGPDPAGRWDPMGLGERVGLVFGSGA